jgi:hypothetical protein
MIHILFNIEEPPMHAHSPESRSPLRAMVTVGGHPPPQAYYEPPGGAPPYTPFQVVPLCLPRVVALPLSPMAVLPVAVLLTSGPTVALLAAPVPMTFLHLTPLPAASLQVDEMVDDQCASLWF